MSSIFQHLGVRSKRPLVEFIPGIVVFFGRFEEKNTNQNAGRVTPPPKTTLTDFAGFFRDFLFPPSVGSESADSWKPEDQGRMDLRPPACD